MDNCVVCETPFLRHYRGKGTRQIYCSKKCKYKAANQTIDCKTCGKLYTRNSYSNKSPEYCSIACIQRSPCLMCGKIIVGRKTWQAGERRFCDRRCAAFANRVVAGQGHYQAKGVRRREKKCWSFITGIVTGKMVQMKILLFFARTVIWRSIARTLLTGS